MTPNELINDVVVFVFIKPMAWAQSDIPIMETPFSLLISFLLTHLFMWIVIHSIFSKLLFTVMPSREHNEDANFFLVVASFSGMALLSIVVQVEYFPDPINTYYLLN